jgi:hypothetical protein
MNKNKIIKEINLENLNINVIRELRDFCIVQIGEIEEYITELDETKESYYLFLKEVDDMC